MRFNSRIRFPAGSVTAALLLTIGLSVSALPETAPVPDEEFTREVIEKHLASIGTEEARSKVESMTVAGTSKAVFKGRGTGETSGLVVMASQGKSNLIGMKFNTPDYPHEKMGYDGKDFTVGFISPGNRSPMGDFLRMNDKTFEVGIMGGVLSTSWELLGYDSKRGKLDCDDGTTKVDGEEMFKCRYRPKKGSDLRIEVFFAKDTFRHRRTEYSRVDSARQGASIDESARQSETRYKMVEEFSNFSAENGLTFPHTYVLFLEVQSNQGSWLYRWEMELQQFQFNNSIDPKEFKVDSY
ncbi:MAG: hypothetical protein IPM63_15900 [Acidobacteriota bacterium]|nr:MAG: hypothetical protein IPM63_15900 [Acidobacteriota bacterium]